MLILKYPNLYKFSDSLDNKELFESLYKHAVMGNRYFFYSIFFNSFKKYIAAIFKFDIDTKLFFYYLKKEAENSSKLNEEELKFILFRKIYNDMYVLNIISFLFNLFNLSFCNYNFRYIKNQCYFIFFNAFKKWFEVNYQDCLLNDNSLNFNLDDKICEKRFYATNECFNFIIDNYFKGSFVLEDYLKVIILKRKSLKKKITIFKTFIFFIKKNFKSFDFFFRKSKFLGDIIIYEDELNNSIIQDLVYVIYNFHIQLEVYCFNNFRNNEVYKNQRWKEQFCEINKNRFLKNFEDWLETDAVKNIYIYKPIKKL